MRRYQVRSASAILSALSSFPAFAQPARQRQAPVIQPRQLGDIRADGPDVISRDGAVKTIAVGTALDAVNWATNTDRNVHLKTNRTTTIAATPEFNHFVAAGCGDAVLKTAKNCFKFSEWQHKNAAP